MRAWRCRLIETAKTTLSQTCINSLIHNPPVYDDNVFTFRDRWGKKIKITDVFPTHVYNNLDELINIMKKQWHDIVFCGVVIKYDKKGRIMNC